MSSLNAGLVTRIGSLFARMASLGLTETITIYSRQPLTDPVSGKVVGRQAAAVGTIVAWIPSGGGSDAVAQEGQRASSTLECYFPISAATLALVSDSTAQTVLVQRGNGDKALFRVANYSAAGGLYASLTLATGSLTDKAGNVR